MSVYASDVTVSLEVTTQGTAQFSQNATKPGHSLTTPHSQIRPGRPLRCGPLGRASSGTTAGPPSPRTYPKATPAPIPAKHHAARSLHNVAMMSVKGPHGINL